jgi:hypothetical protein
MEKGVSVGSLTAGLEKIAQHFSDFRFGSWPRDNTTEEVWAALDRSVAAQLGRFEHIFSDFGLEATVVRATHPERL